jgi:ribosomal protein S25
MSASNLCACGCGRAAPRKWFTEKCREQWRNAQRTPDARRRYEELTKARKELEKYHSVVVEAIVHRMDVNDDILIRHATVRVPVPPVGLWGVQW